jgi:hypothetical protein
MTAWTPTEDKLLRALKASGLSCAQIALRMGRERNSIIGRLNRQRSAFEAADVLDGVPYIVVKPARAAADLPKTPRPLLETPKFSCKQRAALAWSVKARENKRVAEANGNLGKADEAPAPVSEPRLGHPSPAGFQVGDPEVAQPREAIQSSDGRTEGRALKGPTGSLCEDSQDTGAHAERGKRNPPVKCRVSGEAAGDKPHSPTATHTEDLGRAVREPVLKPGPSETTGLGADDPDAGGTPSFGLMTVIDVSPADCRWPFGDPSDLRAFRYCGRPQHGGYGPYCKHHFEMAYTPRGRRELDQRLATGA